MRKRVISTVLMLVMLTAIAGQTAAAEGPPRVAVADVVIQMSTRPRLIKGSTYVPYMEVVRRFYPTATASWENGGALVRAPGLELFMKPDTRYLTCNGRCLYAPDGLFLQDGELMVPLRVLCQALGVNVAWDAASSTAILSPGSGPIASGDVFYDETTLYWLSHIIYAESGNQSLEGKIAVGNVVMNRVNDPYFPNNIKDVLFQRNQFTPARTGTIYRTPNASSVVAAKLVLEGVNTVGNSLYFVNPRVSPNSWAARNRPYVATIGAHAFFA